MISVVTFSTYRLSTAQDEGASQERPFSEGRLYVHAFFFLVFAGVLVYEILESTPMSLLYVVAGRPEIAAVGKDFAGFGKWTTFTFWCNTLTATYFGLATALDVCHTSGACSSLWRQSLPWCCQRCTRPTF